MSWVAMQRYEDLRSDEKNFRRLTGFRQEDFSTLYQFFSEEWRSYFAHFTFNGSPRMRQQLSTRKNSIFGDSQDALLFVLIYLKGGIPQEQLAVTFGMDQPKASKYLSLTQKILLKVIKKNPHILSKRKQRRLWEAIAMRSNHSMVMAEM